MGQTGLSAGMRRQRAPPRKRKKKKKERIGLRVGSGPRTAQISGSGYAFSGRVGSQNLDQRATLIYGKVVRSRSFKVAEIGTN